MYVVATPIGNLADITFRAVETLKEVNFILAEDTRHAINLLNHYNIKKELLSYHSASSKTRVETAIKRIERGESAALISDAGTPCISDPGVTLVAKAIENNITVVPIPGVTAFTALLSVSGVSVGGCLFLGFLSNKSGTRRNQLKNMFENEKKLLVIYESVHRIEAFIEDVFVIFGDSVNITLGREITKQFEQIVRGSPKTILDFFKNGSIVSKGEFVVLIDNRLK